MNEAKFKVGDKVVIGTVSTDWGYYVSTLDDHVGKTTTIIGIDGDGDYLVPLGGEYLTSLYYPEYALTLAVSTAKVRILERGKLLDTTFDTPVAAGDWLRDNGITGEFELVRVESLGKVRASIKVEAA
jgi:hypothetical protein